MSDGAKIFWGIVIAVLVIAVVAVASSRAGRDCEKRGGDWVKNPGSTKTGYSCVMPK